MDTGNVGFRGFLQPCDPVNPLRRNRWTETGLMKMVLLQSIPVPDIFVEKKIEKTNGQADPFHPGIGRLNLIHGQEKCGFLSILPNISRLLTRESLF